MLIIGCGDVGRRVARIFLHAGTEVAGVVRSEASALSLRRQGIQARVADLDQDPLPHLPAGGDGLFHFSPPPDRGIQDSRMIRLLRSLDETDELPTRMVYISTTGVYGDCGGDWVDETRPPQPGTDRTRRRLHAEQGLRDWCDGHAVECVILRVGGIYGPDRLPLQRIRQGLPLVRAEEAPYTNRIHEDDLAQACAAAMRKPVAGETFNVSDGHPGNMAEYFDAIARHAGLPLPPKIPLCEAADRLSPGMFSYMRESRRLDNRKLLRLLDIELRYPTLEQGLEKCFSA